MNDGKMFVDWSLHCEGDPLGLLFCLTELNVVPADAGFFCDCNDLTI